jgi:hypothetical protein
MIFLLVKNVKVDFHHKTRGDTTKFEREEKRTVN